MKIAYLSASRIPSREANSVHVMKMCSALAALGHDVTLVAPDTNETETGVDDLHAFYGVSASFELRKIGWSASRGRAWVYGWRAGRFASEQKFDSVIGRSLHASAIAARSGAPTVWDAHMGTFLRRRRERYLFQWMIGADAFRGVTTNCETLRDAILAEVPAIDGRIVAIHNGADPIGANVVQIDLPTHGNRLNVGYVGQLYPGKGLELIRAIADRATWAVFHVVGGNDDALALLGGDKTLPPNIKIHGFVPPAETPRYLLAFDILIAPYQREVQVAGGDETSAWMSPLKLFDYMAAGKPILCSDLPVLREIIADGRNGILLPPDNSDAWISALRRLATDRDERMRLGGAAQANFLARHTWHHRATGVLNRLAA